MSGLPSESGTNEELKRIIEVLIPTLAGIAVAQFFLGGLFRGRKYKVRYNRKGTPEFKPLVYKMKKQKGYL